MCDSSESSKEKTAARLRTALELFESGKELMRQNIRRRNPALTESQVKKALQEWLHTRPGATNGDYSES